MLLSWILKGGNTYGDGEVEDKLAAGFGVQVSLVVDAELFYGASFENGNSCKY